MATTQIPVFSSAASDQAVAPLFAGTIFLSAFLLFCSEPMIGKMMLPVLGGAASVWVTCLLFFQLMLLAGYGYAHALERYATIRVQMSVHLFLMVAAILFLPIHFSGRPDAGVFSHPTWWLLGQLLKTVGVPLGIVSTTAPLLQNWLKTTTKSSKDPYFLYAVSNAGSLLALLVYPALIEPRSGVRAQSEGWFLAYFGLALLVSAGVWVAWQRDRPNRLSTFSAAQGRMSWKLRLYCLTASFVPSALMLAVTNHMLMNLASVPFSWVMPLAIYLITFMLAFARRTWISPERSFRTRACNFATAIPTRCGNQTVSTQLLWYVLGAHLMVLFQALYFATPP